MLFSQRIERNLTCKSSVSNAVFFVKDDLAGGRLSATEKTARGAGG